MSPRFFWQADLLNGISNLLKPDSTVCGLVVYGSFAANSHDEWSDLDILVVVNDLEQTQLFPNLEWLNPVGDIFTVERSISRLTKLARIVFSDFRRLDLSITDENALLEIDQWPSVSFCDPMERLVVFSRSNSLDQALSGSSAKSSYIQPSSADLNSLVDSFWYKCVLALIKLARNDRLISFHLTLGAIQDCCVLSMVLRDIEKQTNHHRFGGRGNDRLDALIEIDSTPAGIISALQTAARLFDTLAVLCVDEYMNRAEKFAEFCTKLRKEYEPLDNE